MSPRPVFSFRNNLTGNSLSLLGWGNLTQLHAASL